MKQLKIWLGAFIKYEILHPITSDMQSYNRLFDIKHTDGRVKRTC